MYIVLNYRISALAGIFAVFAGVVLLTIGPAFGGEERLIQADEIHELLSNSRVIGKGFEQTFGDPRGHASASTTYWEGKNSSFGRWRVEGNKYCSQWGQNGPWACYKMTVFDEAGQRHVVWIDSSNRRFEGVLQPK